MRPAGLGWDEPLSPGPPEPPGASVPPLSSGVGRGEAGSGSSGCPGPAPPFPPREPASGRSLALVPALLLIYRQQPACKAGFLIFQLICFTLWTALRVEWSRFCGSVNGSPAAYHAVLALWGRGCTGEDKNRSNQENMAGKDKKSSRAARTEEV